MAWSKKDNGDNWLARNIALHRVYTETEDKVISVDELVREECGAHYEQRRILLLRMLAALSDPEVRIDPKDDTWIEIKSLTGGKTMSATRRHLALGNESQLIGLVRDEWKGNRGPQFVRLLRRAKYQLIDQMTNEELVAFREDVFHELARALPR